MNNINTAGWDIGGAHVKLALLDANKMRVFQWHCPLWKGIDELQKCLRFAREEMQSISYKHRVTMTGELVDAFENKKHGVQEIMHALVSFFGESSAVYFYSKQRMLDYQSALTSTADIASANWLASGAAVAKYCESALFVDMGSTTTDLLMIKNGQIANIGSSDYERLCSGELVYTGVVRSCVNTISTSLNYDGQQVPMMAEYFANASDVYRILGQLPEHADLGATCDGREKTIEASKARLARMIGLDYENDESNVWVAAAQDLADKQKQMILGQARKFFGQHGCAQRIVGAGVGRFLLRKLAEQNDIEYVDFAELVLGEQIDCKEHAADCAPAVSLALM